MRLGAIWFQGFIYEGSKEIQMVALWNPSLCIATTGKMWLPSWLFFNPTPPFTAICIPWKLKGRHFMKTAPKAGCQLKMNKEGILKMKCLDQKHFLIATWRITGNVVLARVFSHLMNNNLLKLYATQLLTDFGQLTWTKTHKGKASGFLHPKLYGAYICLKAERGNIQVQ